MIVYRFRNLGTVFFKMTRQHIVDVIRHRNFIVANGLDDAAYPFVVFGTDTYLFPGTGGNSRPFQVSG